MFEAQAEKSRPTESLWRHADFLKLWSAQTISATGDQFTYLAVPLMATLMLDASPTQMGVLAALGTAPFLLISLFAGIWVDRLPRRPILIIGDLGRALVLLSIPIAALAHSLKMRQLFVVEFLVGILSVFFEIAYQAYLPALVDKQSLIEGNTKLAATQSLAGLIGPSLAGVVIQVVSAPSAIVLDAVSYFFSGGLVSMIGRRETQQAQGVRSPMLTEVRGGLAFVLGNPLLRSIAGCTGTFNFFFAAISALYIIFATRGLGLGPARIGFIFGLGNVAGLLGAVGAGWLSARLGLGRTIIGAIFLSGIGMAPIAFATSGTAFSVLMLSRLLFSFATPVYNINQVSLRQSITPHRLQGRMTATMRFLVWGTLPLGGLAGGLLGQIIGLRSAIAIAATGEMSAFLWILFSPARSLQSIPTPLE
jgi:MFS family permease